MKLSDFDYHLPKDMIAQRPLAERDQSKLMVLDRESHIVEHRRFFELPELLDENCVLVFNESRVIPARLRFVLGNGKGEILLIKPLGGDVWECMVRPGPKFKPKFEHQVDTELSFRVKNIMPNGLREIKFECNDFGAYLKTHGFTPTPPYIKGKVDDPEKYQTVYAKTDGSVAAPTAGFHFTKRLFEDLRKKGVETEFVTLHVGLGTFQPVKTEEIEAHDIHSEWFELLPETVKRLNMAKADGKKIVAVGTTSVRVLESCANENRTLVPKSGETNLFIYPGYQWKFVDQMITNFHVPKSSLLMLVASFAGRDFMFDAYQKAKDANYRFFSFGDSMLIR